MNRGITIWCEVVCDKCGNTMTGANYRNSTTIAKLRKRAKENGWKIVDDVMTYCPDCIQRLKENKQ